MERIKKIFTGGIEDVKKKINIHLELCQQSLQSILGLISRDLTKIEVDEIMRKITALEREGDEITRELVDHVAQGSVVPTITHITLILLDNIDNVLDLTYFAVKEIRRGFHLWEKDYIYSIISNEIREILNIIKTMLEYLQNLIKSRNDEEMRHYTRLINSLEEEIDEIKEEILDKIYGLELNAVEFNHLVTLVYTADKIADNIQDAAFHFATVLSSI
ncbi:MAG: DUF47 family protein [Pyrobaculum sp.]